MRRSGRAAGQLGGGQAVANLMQQLSHLLRGKQLTLHGEGNPRANHLGDGLLAQVAVEDEKHALHRCRGKDLLGLGGSQPHPNELRGRQTLDISGSQVNSSGSYALSAHDIYNTTRGPDRPVGEIFLGDAEMRPTPDKVR